MSTLSLAVNENNDIYLDQDGNIATVTDLEATRQDCDHAAKTILGEMPLNVDQGIPYFQTVFVGTPNITQLDSALRAAFLNANPGVVQVLTLDITVVGKTLSYTAQIESIYGQFYLSGSLNNAV